MGNVYNGIPVDTALALKNKYGLSLFVETGTLTGRTATWAAGHFKEVITIEMDEGLFSDLLNMHRGKYPNINFVYGDSREAIRDLVINKPALFWLDAHWSHDLGYARPDKGECPLLDELWQIGQLDSRGHVIMIDDARMFQGTPPRPHRPDEWPGWKKLTHAIKMLPWKTQVRVIDDVIIVEPV